MARGGARCALRVFGQFVLGLVPSVDVGAFLRLPGPPAELPVRTGGGGLRLGGLSASKATEFLRGAVHGNCVVGINSRSPHVAVIGFGPTALLRPFWASTERPDLRSTNTTAPPRW